MKVASVGGEVGASISVLGDNHSQDDFHPSDRGYMLYSVDGEEVNPLVRHGPNGKQFTVHDYHIKLLSHLWIRWELTSYGYGVPCVDVKHPYGNGGIVDEIINILELPYEYDENLDGYPDEVEAKIRQFHAEMQVVLQILVRNACIKPQEYIADRHNQNWKPVTPNTLLNSVGE